MIIKKYIVSDMKEALVRAKYELGGEAVIVSQRMIRTGKWYHFFKKKELEVTVAVEETHITKNNEEFKKEKVREDDDSSLYQCSSDSLKERLEGYCKLHGKKDYNLTLEEKKDFLKIVLNESLIDKKRELSRINVLVGPTGVGKTTTIAKIAAREYLMNKKKVGLITMDTYRIGAIEQLKTYANILDVPFEVANTPTEMDKKINELNDCDIILVDTLGTSFKDINKLNEIKRYLSSIDEKINTYLVLSVSTDKDTMVTILEKYRELKYDAIIITKLDEVSNISNLWFILENSKYPLQYFCHGQDVPDDMQVATLDNIFDYCEENFNNDGSSKQIT